MNFKKRLTIIIAIPLGISLILSLILIFLGSDIIERGNHIKQLQSELNFHLRATESLALLRKDSEQAQSYLPAIKNILPTRDQLIEFNKDLTNLVKQNQVSLNLTLGQESLRTETELGVLNFNLTAQGEFDKFLDFLKTLENNRYFIKLITIDLSRQDSSFKTSMSGQVFSF